jgi:S1-C subfamily serine protease
VLVVVLLLLAPIAGGTGVAYYMSTRQGQANGVGSGTDPTGPAVPLGPPQVGSSQGGPNTDPSSTGAAGNPSIDGKAISKIVNPSIVDVNTTLGLQNARAAGTGILLNSTGLVLTNNHVIAGATDIKAVSVTTGRTFQASVVGYDRSHDVAVIQLTGASGLTHITLGDSSKVKIDDPIVAIGNAGGLGGTPTVVTGSVTALNQSITATDEDGANPRRLSGLIQIAADIRAGDSGGPLVDKSAHLIGMDTAAAVDSSGQSAGTGYAIPVNAALSIAKQIEAGTSTSTIHIGQTAMLGVSATDAKGATAGAEVTDFIPGGAARQSGIQVGDVIVAVDGHAVATASDLTDIINGHHPGDQVKVQWVRNGQRGSSTVSLGVGPAA